MVSRRAVLGALVASPVGGLLHAAVPDRRIHLIAAPCHLGLRPPSAGHEPGVWKAPEALLNADLVSRLAAAGIEWLEKPNYNFGAQPGTRVRNGQTLREYSQRLGGRVRAALTAGELPVVLGGDCSILMGCLLGLRRAGGRGLVHVDGHSDFFHPGNYDSASRLGTAAGMDLALVTGRGERLLTSWPGVEGPLVRDEEAFQVGEREAEAANWSQGYGDIATTRISRFEVQRVLRQGIPETLRALSQGFAERRLERVWLHVDFDVLDQSELPAVDSPGSPGLSAGQLGELTRGLLASGFIAGVDFTIYDPELDPKGVFVEMLRRVIGKTLSGGVW